MDDVPIIEELNSELTGLNKGDKLKIKKEFIIGLIAALILLLIILIIIIVILSKGDKNKKHRIGEINLIYDVDRITIKTKILGDDYVKNSDFDIYINGKLIKYSKEFLFSQTGQNKVKILLYDNLNMDYMFKDIQNLISINMTSSLTCQISSMISTFENCKKILHLMVFLLIN